MKLTNDMMTRTWAHNLSTSQEADWLRTWKMAQDDVYTVADSDGGPGFARWVAGMICHVHAHGQELDKDRVY